MILLMALVIGVLGMLLWILVAQCMMNMPDWVQGLDGVGDRLCVFLRDCCNGLETRFGVDAEELEYVVINRVNIFIENFRMNVLPGMVNESLSYAKRVFSVGAFLAVTGIAVILLVKDYDKIMEALCSGKESIWILRVLEEVIHYIVIFLRAQVLIVLAISVLCAIVLAVADVDNGVIFGILAGIMDVLPFIGTGLILVPLTIWQLLNGWYWQAGICLILYGACVLLREMLEPKLIGEKVGIYPVAILLSVYAGIKLFGAWGILKGPLGLVIIYHGMKQWMKNSSNS